MKEKWWYRLYISIGVVVVVVWFVAPFNLEPDSPRQPWTPRQHAEPSNSARCVSPADSTINQGETLAQLAVPIETTMLPRSEILFESSQGRILNKDFLPESIDGHDVSADDIVFELADGTFGKYAFLGANDGGKGYGYVQPNDQNAALMIEWVSVLYDQKVLAEVFMLDCIDDEVALGPFDGPAEARSALRELGDRARDHKVRKRLEHYWVLPMNLLFESEAYQDAKERKGLLAEQIGIKVTMGAVLSFERPK